MTTTTKEHDQSLKDHSVLNRDDRAISNGTETLSSSPTDLENGTGWPTNNDDDDEDEHVSVASSSSSSSSSDDDDDDDDYKANKPNASAWESLNYVEKRAQRIARNEKYLHSLGLLGQTSHHHKPSQPRKRTRHDQPNSANDNNNNKLENGMLLPDNVDSHNVCRSLADVYRSFPGRATEIRALHAHLEYAVGVSLSTTSTTSTTTTTATPLWITGSGGTGKSAVLQAVLQSLQASLSVAPSTTMNNNATTTSSKPSSSTSSSSTTTTNPPPLICYVSPSHIPPPVSVEGMVVYIYQTLLQQLGLHHTFLTRRTKQKTTHRGSADAAAGADSVSTTHNNKANNKTNNKNNNPPRKLRRRDSVIDYRASNEKRRSKTSRLTAQDMAETTASTPTKSHTAIWTLGRFWKRLTGNRPSVLVLDQVWMVREFNVLAQFLLLPQHLQLNLTIVVVTQNALLDQTPLTVMTSNSSGSLSTCLHPVRIHFPAYRGKAVLEKIVSLPRIRALIAGSEHWNGSDANDFRHKVYRSFTRTLIQATYEMTKNVKEIIRFGRVLWPQYIELLQPSKIQHTLDIIARRLASFQPPVEATTARVQQELLTYLDSKAMPQIRSLVEEHLFALSVPITDGPKEKHEIPKRAVYLLLAAYLCQMNRPDRDKHLFTIQKNGRRRKSATEQNTASEDTAFGTNTTAQPKSLRLRTFPLERMLSIFVSLVSLHQGDAHAASLPERETERLLAIGDVSLLQNLQLLQDTGLLHEQGEAEANDPIRLSGRRYWCELTEEEALRLAEKLNFPLTRYVL